MTSWFRFCAAFGLLLAWTGSSLAKDPQVAQVAVKYMAQEIVECAAYFDIVSLALLNSNAADTADKYIRSRKLAVGRADSLSPGVVNARYNSSIKGMTQKIIMSNIPKNIAEDLSNVVIADISVLHDQYGRTCKQVMESPGDRAEYWMQQTDDTSR